MIDQKSSIHWSFWLVGAVSLLWNAMGTLNYLGQMNPEMVASMPETHRAIIEGRPAWATAGFAIAVFGGVLGSLMLLFRKSVAIYIFVASMLGVLVTMVHTLRVAGSGIEFSAFEFSMMIVMPVVVAAVLIWYAMHSKAKGWVR